MFVSAAAIVAVRAAGACFPLNSKTSEWGRSRLLRSRMQLTYETTLSEVAEAPVRRFLRGKTYATNRWRGACLCAVAFGVFALLGFHAKPSVNLPVICAAAAAWGAGVFLLAYKSVVRRRITQYVAGELKGPWPSSTTYVINSTQLINTSAGLTFTYRLADLEGVTEDARWVELFLGERAGCVIPLRAFASAEQKAQFLAALGAPHLRSQ